LEPLACRALLATFHVTSLDDSGPGTLRAAIAAANDPTDTDPTNEIDFDSSLRGGTINLTTFRNDSTGIFPGPTALVVSSDITIVGSGQTIQRSTASGTADFRLLFVTSNGNLTLQDLTLSNGVARGGDGFSGGGGAAGLGGAVFNQGTLALQRVTLSGNQAIGGNGGEGGTFDDSPNFPVSTGGGGGLGGSASGSDGGGPNGGTSSGAKDGGFGGGGAYNGGNGGFGGGAGAGPGDGLTSSHGGFGGGGGGAPTDNGGFGGGNGGSEPYGGGGGGAGLGGAIFNDEGGMLTVTNSTLSGNTARGGNGGVWHLSNGSPGGSGGAGSSYGAAVFNRNGTVVINSSTLAGNTVTPGLGGGGAVYNLLLSGTAAALTLKNSILAGSGTGVTDLVNDGGSVSGGSNLVQSQSGVPVQSGVISLTTDPKLGPLQNNGGHTKTRALLPGSPAIDAGDNGLIPADVTTDQRGFSRRIDGDGDGTATVDLGAFEVRAPTITTLTPGASSITEGGSISLGGSFTDPPGFVSAHTVIIDWGDGSPTTTLNLSAGTMSFGGPSFTHKYADNPSGQPQGSFTLKVTVSNTEGQVSRSTPIQVNNAAPTASISNNGPINEGSSATVSLSGPSDPSTADTAAGFHYSFATTTAGLASTYAAAGTTASASLGFADNGTYTVYGRIFDKDDGYTQYTTTVVVNNVAPTAAPTADQTIDEGSSVTVSLTSPFDPSSADTAAGFRYSFALSSAGLATSYAAAGTASSASFTFDDGPNTRTVYGRIFDKDGGYTDYQTAVTVNNVAPTASISNNGPIDEASSVTVGLGGASDPSTADTAAGFRYSFATTTAGLATTYAAAGTAASASLGFADNGTYTVYGRIFDKDDGYTQYTTTVDVNNVAPTASLTGPSSGVPGQPLTFTLGASDPSSVDQAAGFSYVINWGDGSPVQTIARTAGNDTGVQVTHVYTRSGPYTVQLTATDKDNGTSTVATTSITISSVALEDDPSLPGQKALAVGGTMGNDTIVFNPGGKSGAVQVIINGIPQGTFSPTGHLIAYGLAGDDTIQVAGALTLPTILFGGDGNDTIKGGNGNNIIVGGAGNDTLIGGSGRDILIGGDGADTLTGNGDDDILIAGTTDYDTNEEALCALMAEWGRIDETYATRVNDLINGISSGGVTCHLDSSTVHTDAAIDVLTGSSGTDWFFAQTQPIGSKPADKVKDRVAGEIVTSIS
jgi:hypothetical protein